MFTKSLLLGLGLAALALGDPIPQAAATTSYNPAAISSEIASLSSYEAEFSSLYAGLPSLPASVQSVLATAFPTSLGTATDLACDIVTSQPAWYNSLPADVKSAFTSYESALASWSKAHSAQLASLTSGFSLPTGAASFSIGVCSNTGAAVAGTTTKNAGAGSTGTATSSGSASGSTSKGAAPRATGTVAVSFAGVVGVLGLMAAL
jgi:hypothetical protein